jgi:hypothetical protein
VGEVAEILKGERRFIQIANFSWNPFCLRLLNVSSWEILLFKGMLGDVTSMLELTIFCFSIFSLFFLSNFFFLQFFWFTLLGSFQTRFFFFVCFNFERCCWAYLYFWQNYVCSLSFSILNPL